jgi:hypothetical protein
MKLSTCLNQFFVQYLPHIKGSRQTTIHAYRDTYRLLLPFAYELSGSLDAHTDI